MSRIYVATSWRNELQPDVVARLRAEGHEVYDFRHPTDDVAGFSWRHCVEERPPWSAEKTREVLAMPRAEEGFRHDLGAMEWADTFVMVQPCGRSAALELGWGAGRGKRTVVLLADGQEPELMLKCARHLCTSLDEVVALLAPKSGLEGARSCRGCKHSGFDIADGPYCTQASVAEGFPAGILLHSSRVGERCPGPSHPHWEPRPT